MYKLRSGFLLFFALLFAALATPAIAASPTKQFAAAYPATVPNGTGVEIKVTFYNLTPNGNSYINSVELFPAPGVQFTGAVRTATGTASGTMNGTALIINNFAGIGPNRSLDFYVKVNVTLTGCTSQDWPVPLANAGNSLQGDSFTPLYDLVNPATTQPYMQLRSAIGCDGVLACGEQILAGVGSGVTDARRGWFNKDGTSCVKVGYDFTNDIMGDPIPPLMQGNDILLQWDVSSQPGAAFTYTAYWKPEWVGANGLPTSQTKFKWFVNGSLMTTAVAGRACLSASLPAPYGTIVSYTGPNQLVVFVPSALPANWAVAPTSTSLSFPVQIGKERLQLTYVSQVPATGGANYTYTVQRNAAWTGFQDSLSSGEVVMSNPLPLDSSMTPNQMQMCIVDEGFTTVDPALCPTTPAPSNPPVACVQKSTKASDLGDGYMIGN